MPVMNLGQYLRSCAISYYPNTLSFSRFEELVYSSCSEACIALQQKKGYVISTIKWFHNLSEPKFLFLLLKHFRDTSEHQLNDCCKHCLIDNATLIKAKNKICMSILSINWDNPDIAKSWRSCNVAVTCASNRISY